MILQEAGVIFSSLEWKVIKYIWLLSFTSYIFDFFFLIKVLVFKYQNWDNWNKLLWKRLGMMKTQWRHRGDFLFSTTKEFTYFVVKKALWPSTQSTSFYIQSIHWLRLTFPEFMTCQLYHCPFMAEDSKFTDTVLGSHYWSLTFTIYTNVSTCASHGNDLFQ